MIYTKLLFFFPKQSKERNKFIKEFLLFGKEIVEEICFLRNLCDREDICSSEEMDEILNSLDVAFEQDYYTYEDLMAYMENSIEKREFYFYNDTIWEGEIRKKIKVYQQQFKF